MSKVTKTNLELIAFYNTAKAYLEKHKDGENKLCVSLRSVIKQAIPLIDDYNDKLTDCRLDNCGVDEKTKIILKDASGNIQFTPEGQKKVNKFSREILNDTVEINQRLRPENDSLELTIDEKEAFSEIVINKWDADDGVFVGGNGVLSKTK